MTTHLSPAMLSALVDGELSVEQSAAAAAHLDQCPSCTSTALNQALLKTATAKAGSRYAVPAQLGERLRRLASSQELNAPRIQREHLAKTLFIRRIASLALPIAALLLLLVSGSLLFERHARNSERASLELAAERAALVTEISDLHIATLAASQPPQVISSDRHTVKPWFQGKLPFSFNLPDNLPADTRLDGANLTYLHNHPVAQLLYSVGRHRVSVFIQERSGTSAQNPTGAEHAGFHVAGFDTSDLEVTAVSDIDPSRLSDLVRAIERAQTKR
jgi:anti-sigma factor RsiW